MWEEPISLAHALFSRLHAIDVDEDGSSLGTPGAGETTHGFLMMLAYAGVIQALRRAFERTVGAALVRCHKVSRGARPPKHDAVLEDFYVREGRRPGARDLERLAGATGGTPRGVDLWFRRRRNADLPSTAKKLSETSWRFCAYLLLAAYGLATVSGKPWFADTRHCWLGYPRQERHASVTVYYMLEGGLYLSLLFSVMSDVKRKDFNEQVLHHLATIGLIAFSYAAGFVRVGSLVMAVHDVSDVFLEAAKLAFYCGRRRLADALFVAFCCVFYSTRFYLLPFHVLRSVVVECREIVGPFAFFYVFAALLLLLQLLHCFWGFLIARMLLRVLLVGDVSDDRSDREEDTDDDDDDARQASRDCND